MSFAARYRPQVETPEPVCCHAADKLSPYIHPDCCANCWIAT